MEPSGCQGRQNPRRPSNRRRGFGTYSSSCAKTQDLNAVEILRLRPYGFDVRPDGFETSSRCELSSTDGTAQPPGLAQNDGVALPEFTKVEVV